MTPEAIYDWLLGSWAKWAKRFGTKLAEPFVLRLGDRFMVGAIVPAQESDARDLWFSEKRRGRVYLTASSWEELARKLGVGQ